jgi:hypothetical protein
MARKKSPNYLCPVPLQESNGISSHFKHAADKRDSVRDDRRQVPFDIFGGGLYSEQKVVLSHDFLQK